VATSVEGFIQQVAVSYIRTGHFFYVSGTLDADVDAEAIDAKLIHKYGVDVSRWARALRKANGEANLQYIRHDRFFLLMATHGRSLFFELEGEQVIRSERELCRRLKTDLLFRWFLDLQPSDEVFDHSVFTHNRDRLADHGITQKFFDQVVKQAIEAGLTSDEHFTVDGSLIQSHASLKSLKKIEREASKNDDDHTSCGSGRNPSVDFKGERRTNATHRSTTDPEAKLFRKGDGVGAFLCHSGHALTENRHGLVMSVRVDEAKGTAERENTLRMLDHLERRHGVRPSTLGADKGYDAGPFLVELERRWIEPHVAIKSGTIDPLGDRADDGTWARWFVRSEQRRGERANERPASLACLPGGLPALALTRGEPVWFGVWVRSRWASRPNAGFGPARCRVRSLRRVIRTGAAGFQVPVPFVHARAWGAGRVRSPLGVSHHEHRTSH
jgi:IS5 family transposase